jgi:hypothetical protein
MRSLAIIPVRCHQLQNAQVDFQIASQNLTGNFRTPPHLGSSLIQVSAANYCTVRFAAP